MHSKCVGKGKCADFIEIYRLPPEDGDHRKRNSKLSYDPGLGDYLICLKMDRDRDPDILFNITMDKNAFVRMIFENYYANITFAGCVINMYDITPALWLHRRVTVQVITSNSYCKDSYIYDAAPTKEQILDRKVMARYFLLPLP